MFTPDTVTYRSAYSSLIASWKRCEQIELGNKFTREEG